MPLACLTASIGLSIRAAPINLFVMTTNELPPVNIRPLTPIERDLLLLEIGYRDHIRLSLQFLKMMDARDEAIRFIAASGLLEAYGRYCEQRNLSLSPKN